MSVPPVPPPASMPPSYDPQFAPPAQRPPTNGLAMAAMIVGIVSVVIPIAAPVAIVLGIVALKKVKKTGQPGKAHALAGIGCGVLGIIIGTVVSIGMVLALSKARESARLVMTQSNLRQIGIAIHAYAADNRSAPPASLAELRSYLGKSGNLFVSPRGTDQPIPATATDAEWKAKLVPGSGFCSFTYLLPTGPRPRLVTIRNPSQYILVYETNLPAGKPVPALFADGHVQNFSADEWAGILADLKAGKNPPKLPGDKIGSKR